MATFSTTNYVAAANGSTASTTGPHGTSPPVPFAGSTQATKAPASGGVALQVAAHQQHIFHQSLAQQQVRASLITAAAPAGSPPSSTQSTSQQAQQQQNSMQQAFQVN
jgi:hypothetical protein